MNFRKSDGTVNTTKARIATFFCVVLFALLCVSPKLIDKNDYGNIQIRQSMKGTMSVQDTFGFYAQGFDKLTTYKVGNVLFFSKHKIDGGTSEYAAPVEVTFNGNSKAHISGVLKYKLSKNHKKALLVHEDYGSGLNFKDELIRQYVTEVLIQTAPLMTAEEAYAPRKTEFKKIAEDQLKYGIFKKSTRTITINEKVLNANGVEKIQRKKAKIVELVLDDMGNPILDATSPLVKYGIEVINFTLKEFDFDDKTEELIGKKRSSELEKVLSETEAQRAQQDTIKAIAQGKEKKARAEATANVAKTTATINAQREKEVAQLNAEKVFNVGKLEAEKDKVMAELQAEKELNVARLEKQAAVENAQAKLVVGEAAARVAKLKVAAGLTPLAKARIDMQTQIGVARELAKLKLPTTFIGGGGGGGKGGFDPFTAIGINQLLEINKKMSGQKK